MISYKEYGYYLKKSFLNASEKKFLLKMGNNILSEYIPIKNIKSFEDLKLHRKLIDLRKKYPKKFGEMYDKFILSSSLRKIFYKEKFINIFAKLLNAKPDNIFINGYMFRFDAPYDKRNSLDWHQDSPYYQMTHPKYNSGVCWVSITKNSLKNGSLNFIPGSHKKGFIKTSSKKGQKLASEQFTLKVDRKSKKKIKVMNTNFGDAAFFDMNLKHKSGLNNSSKIRMTIGCRFHNMNEEFNYGKEKYIFDKTSKSTLF